MPPIESVTAGLFRDRSQVNVIVCVRDSDGLEGVGESWSRGGASTMPSSRAERHPPIIAVVNDLLAPKLAGRDPMPSRGSGSN